jgi:hypothetical protein
LSLTTSIACYFNSFWCSLWSPFFREVSHLILCKHSSLQMRKLSYWEWKQPSEFTPWTSSHNSFHNSISGKSRKEFVENPVLYLTDQKES